MADETPRVALVHDWLNGMRGGERCLEAFLSLYPSADVFTLFHVPGATTPRIDRHVKRVSWLNGIPGARRHYRMLLPLFPLGVRQFDLSGYDMVISLSHAAAKNVRVPRGVPHYCYCFTPIRYVWDQAWEYFGKATPILWPVLAGLRRWDAAGAERVTDFVAISKFISARIRCFYKRGSTVIYPPVEAGWIGSAAQGSPGEAFLLAGALVPYKRPEVVVEAATALGIPLWVAGKGPMEQELRRIAGPTVKFMGRVSDADLADLYRRCRAMVYAGVEDFGIMPVECMAAGRPVIALDAGGFRETVRGVKPWLKSREMVAEPTGLFVPAFGKPLVERFQDSLRYFMAHEELFTIEACRARARDFSPQRFADEWASFILRGGADTARLVPRAGMTEQLRGREHA